MTVASEITRIEGNISAAYTAADAKGATMPATENSDNLATCIASISGGSSTPTERAVKANYYVDTSGVVHNLQYGSSTLSATETSITTQSFSNKYQNVSTIDMVDLSAITSITNNYAFMMTFNGSSVKKVDISGLESATGDIFYITFAGCPIEEISWPTKMHTIQTSFFRAFEDHHLSGVLDLSWIYTIENNVQGAFMQTFAASAAKVSGITKVDLSGLKSIKSNNCFTNTFNNLTDVTASIIDISNLESITGSYSIRGLCKGATGDYVFPKVNDLNGSNVLSSAFVDSSELNSISFPALTSTSFGSNTNQFNDMLANTLEGITIANVTVHFPSNLQAVIGSWTDVTAGFGGTNTTVLFDLPATS